MSALRRTRPERALEAGSADSIDAGPGETLVCAVSGGVDSAALAGLLAKHAAERGAGLVLAHVNHGVRPSADCDEGVVLALGAQLGVRTVARKLGPGRADEARLREERYALLASVARECGAARIFTAHHAEDQTETVLLALFRGSGQNGLGGMASRRSLAPGLELVRPLLGVSRRDLIAYAGGRHLPYAVDPTNADLDYKRNALRASLTELRPKFPGLDEAVARCAALARDAASPSPRALARETLRREIGAATGSLRDLSFERLEAVALALERGSPGRHFLRDGVEVNIRRSV